MLIKRDQDRKLRGEDIPASEITAERLYLDRRAFIAGAAALALAPSSATRRPTRSPPPPRTRPSRCPMR